MYGHVLFTAAVACAEPAPPAGPVAQVGEPGPAFLTLAELVAAADRRAPAPDDAVVLGARAPDPALRRAALLAAARAHDPGDASIALLRAGLRDPDATVRDAASLGLGALGPEAPRGLDAVLAGAVVAEEDAATRAVMLRDLGRLATDRALAAVAAHLRDADPLAREAACLAVAERGIAARPVSRETRSRVASLLDSAQPEPVRFACAYALARVPPSGGPAELRGETVALSLAVGDPSPRVRQFAYRALGRAPEVDVALLAHGIEDDDWQVRVQALRALGAAAARDEAGVRALAGALRRARERLVEGRTVRPGGPVHVFLVAVEAAAPVARSGPLHDVAAALLTELADLEPSRDQGLVHCAAAELVDRGRGWPSRVTTCGGESVAEWERAVLEANVLGDLEGAEAQRLARLRRLMEHETPAVREATVAAAAKIVAVDANALILEALAIDDAGVRAAALEALTTVAERRPTELVVPPPLPAARVRDALRSLREATPEDELETLVTWIGAVAATDARELAPQVQALTGHSNQGVRERARALGRTWALEVSATHEPIPNPIDGGALGEPGDRPRVRLHTTRGPVVIELRPDAAPTTVARFLGLVADGFFEDRRVHRVVPAFVVQTGDPRGDGYGGPGWAQRCEDNRLAYDRGTVGMALAGRDTGGSQFFVTHGPQPHLEGRYTAFGQVLEGMDAIDALQRGDRLVRAELVSR